MFYSAHMLIRAVSSTFPPRWLSHTVCVHYCQGNGLIKQSIIFRITNRSSHPNLQRDIYIFLEIEKAHPSVTLIKDTMKAEREMESMAAVLRMKC